MKLTHPTKDPAYQGLLSASGGLSNAILQSQQTKPVTTLLNPAKPVHPLLRKPGHCVTVQVDALSLLLAAMAATCLSVSDIIGNTMLAFMSVGQP